MNLEIGQIVKIKEGRYKDRCFQIVNLSEPHIADGYCVYGTGFLLTRYEVIPLPPSGKMVCFKCGEYCRQTCNPV